MVIQIEDEYKRADSAYFITLTYDNENLPIINGRGTLVKRDLQLFFKRLRKDQETFEKQNVVINGKLNITHVENMELKPIVLIIILFCLMFVIGLFTISRSTGQKDKKCE